MTAFNETKSFSLRLILKLICLAKTIAFCTQTGVQYTHLAKTETFKPTELLQSCSRPFHKTSNKTQLRATLAMTLQNDGVLGTTDLVDGLLLAFVLAFSYSYLNRDSSNIILWRTGYSELESKEEDTVNYNEDHRETKINRTVFGKDSWIEVSRPENYIFFNKRRKRDEIDGEPRKESKLYLVGLLVLFVPLFSIEFFFAISRQFICDGDPFTQSNFATYLCSAHR